MQKRIISTALGATLLAGTAWAAPVSLRGDLVPMNTGVQSAQTVTGKVTVDVADGQAIIEVNASGLTPGMHMAHLHGFKVTEPEEATCPGVEADANGDGAVDLFETHKAAGVTLVPLTDDPVSLSIASEAYPEADEDGQVAYTQTVDLAALDQAMQEKYNTPAALASRVIFFHGVPEGVDLADSVQSLEGVPSHATLPIACAELNPSL